MFTTKCWCPMCPWAVPLLHLPLAASPLPLPLDPWPAQGHLRQVVSRHPAGGFRDYPSRAKAQDAGAGSLQAAHGRGPGRDHPVCQGAWRARQPLRGHAARAPTDRVLVCTLPSPNTAHAACGGGEIRRRLARRAADGETPGCHATPHCPRLVHWENPRAVSVRVSPFFSAMVLFSAAQTSCPPVPVLTCTRLLHTGHSRPGTTAS